LIIGPTGDLIGDHWYNPTNPDEDFVMPGEVFFNQLIRGDNIVCCPGVVFRKECIETLSNFDLHLPFTADWEMWLRISLHYDVGYLSQPLIKYRMHSDNETLNFKGTKGLDQFFQAKAAIIRKYPERIPALNELRVQVGKEVEERGREALFGAFNLPEEGQNAYLQIIAEAHRMQIDRDSGEIDRWMDKLVSELAFFRNENVFVSPGPAHAAELPPGKMNLRKKTVDFIKKSPFGLPLTRLKRAMTGWRLINFPGEYPLGYLKLRKKGLTEWHWKEYLQARGTIEIPPDKEVLLEVFAETIPYIQGLAALKPGDLHSLIINQAAFGDREIVILENLTGLANLDLRGTQITDQGVRSLYGLTNLVRLVLPAEISPAAIRKLQTELPECKIRS
jgi:hypothetical protein